MTKILLVEDNEMNRDMLSRRLERKGYAVVMALDGGVVTVSDFDESSAITRMIPYTAKARTTTATAPTVIIAAGF